MKCFSSSNKRVAIVGAGPAGCALAIYLARNNIRSVLFDPLRRPELIVGESLIPSIVTLLRDLEIEDEVRSYSVFKPGAVFYLRPDEETTIVFAREGKNLPSYAYNVPRDKLDKTFVAAAKRAGATIIEARPKIVVTHALNLVSLDEEATLQAARVLGGKPDLIVDATGRARVFAKALELPSVHGTRDDIALFAHLDRALMPHAGSIHINRLSSGWSWRIPLPDKVSVGIVLPKEKGKGSAEKIYDTLLTEEPILSPLVRGAQRLTPVAKYSNYQLISKRFFGNGWASVGDAAGFVDPIFSSGLHLALSGARELAAAITESTLPEYERKMQRHIRAWQHIGESFYNGRLFGLTRASKAAKDYFPWNMMLPTCESHLRRTLSGMVPPTSLAFLSARFMLTLPFGVRYGKRLRIR